MVYEETLNGYAICKAKIKNSIDLVLVSTKVNIPAEVELMEDCPDGYTKHYWKDYKIDYDCAEAQFPDEYTVLKIDGETEQGSSIIESIKEVINFEL